MENVIANLTNESDNLVEQINSTRFELKESKKEIGKEFLHEKELVEKIMSLEKITSSLNLSNKVSSNLKENEDDCKNYFLIKWSCQEMCSQKYTPKNNIAILLNQFFRSVA